MEYIDCYLSEQIPEAEWQAILKDYPEIRDSLDERLAQRDAATINNILVTGGAGYIGSILVRLLLQKNYKVTVLDRFHFGDTLPTHPSLHLIKGDIRTVPVDQIRGHDAVIDLAALSNDPVGDLDPTLTNSINHLGRLRIASLAKECRVKRYILPSSASVYGFNEDALTEESETNPLTTYASANLNAERDILKLSDHSFTVVVLRQSTVFGVSPRMRFDLAINGMAKGYLTNGSLPILKDGKQWRPFLHVKDAARALALCLTAPTDKISGEIFNVGSDENNYQIFDLAKEVALGLNLPFKYEWYGDLDSRSYKLSFSKIKRTLGFDCKYNACFGAREVGEAIQEGFIDCEDPKTITLNWYKELIEEGVAI